MTYYQRTQTTKLLLTAVAITLFTFLLLGCDNCSDIGGIGKESDVKIYFTAINSNNSVPNVFFTDENLSEINLVQQNAIIFSPPAKNDKLAFITKNTSNETILNLQVLRNKNVTELLKDNQIFTISQPILSPAGNLIAFDAGVGRLLLYDIEKTSTSIVTNQLITYSTPSFSYDGLYLSYLINNDGFIKIIVVSADFPQNEILRIDLSGFSAPRNSQMTINWASDSYWFSFAYSKDEMDYVIVRDLFGQQNTVNSVRTELGFDNPTLSPSAEFLLFTSSDGGLWVRSLDENDIRYSKLTDGQDLQAILPQWSSDGKSIIFYSTESISSPNSSAQYDLFKMKVKYSGNIVSAESLSLISSNVLRAYWGI